MHTTFENLISSYLENKVGIAENFLSVALTTHLKENLLSLDSKNLLLSAGMGNHANLSHDKLIRNDKTYWLDRKHKDTHEDSFFDLMDGFVSYLNSTCYTGITGYEFHYALYEKGSFYKRHLDQFRDNKSRAYTFILYLNDNWQEKDGGELCIYHDDHSQIIAPLNGTGVFFKSSELEHEVLLSHQPRLSITGWLNTN